MRYGLIEIPNRIMTVGNSGWYVQHYLFLASSKRHFRYSLSRRQCGELVWVEGEDAGLDKLCLRGGAGGEGGNSVSIGIGTI